MKYILPTNKLLMLNLGMFSSCGPEPRPSDLQMVMFKLLIACIAARWWHLVDVNFGTGLKQKG